MVDLAKMARGKVATLVEDALLQVAENIADERTEAEMRRRVTIEIDVQPDAQRHVAIFVANVKSKLAPSQGVGGVLYLQKGKDGKVDLHEGEPPEDGQMEFEIVKGKKG